MQSKPKPDSKSKTRDNKNLHNIPCHAMQCNVYIRGHQMMSVSARKKGNTLLKQVSEKNRERKRKREKDIERDRKMCVCERMNVNFSKWIGYIWSEHAYVHLIISMIITRELNCCRFGLIHSFEHLDLCDAYPSKIKWLEISSASAIEKDAPKLAYCCFFPIEQTFFGTKIAFFLETKR